MKLQNTDTGTQSDGMQKVTRKFASRRKVLMVAGEFVPVSSNSTFRALGFVEELPDLGWEPFVLTQSPKQSLWSQDSELKAECPLTQVEGNALLWRILKKLAPIAPEHLLADRARSWVPFAVAKGVQLTLRHRVEVIFGSFQPWSALVTAYLIARYTGRPLVAEFRDPVMSVWRRSSEDQPRIELARRIALHARGIVTTTAEISEDIMKLSNGQLRDAPLVLPHGFREVDHQAFHVPPLADDFIMTFTGSLYRHRCIDTFCAAIAGFLESNPQLAGRVRLKIVGRPKEGSFEFLQNCANAHGIQNCVELLPWQSQQSLKDIIAASHMVWCTDTLAGSGEGVIVPGKLAKMFACGRPLLALCKVGGATWRAVSETAAGEGFDYGDVPGIQGFISRIHEAASGRRARPHRNEAKLSDYSFHELTLRLADLFQKALTPLSESSSPY
jgi:hypothetical protein